MSNILVELHPGTSAGLDGAGGHGDYDPDRSGWHTCSIVV